MSPWATLGFNGLKQNTQKPNYVRNVSPLLVSLALICPYFLAYLQEMFSDFYLHLQVLQYLIGD